jgi:hypothetical protein
MAFAAAGLFEDLLGRPVQLAEVVGEEDSGKERSCAGAAAHAQGDLVVELEMEARGEAAGGDENIDVGSEDEVVVEVGGEFGVAARGVDVEGTSLRDLGVDGEIESHGKA